MKKVLSLVLVLTLVLGSFSFAFAAPTDVVGTEYEDAVERLGQLKVLEGYPDGTFKPANTITRAEFAAVVVRAKGLDAAAQAAKGTTVFTDVPAGNWAAGYINIASKLGFVKGMGDGTFAPNSPVTYEQAVTMVIRVLGYDPAAEARGGYPYGHLIVANENGLLDAVKGVQGLAAPRGLVAQLVDNALEIPQMIQVGYGTQTKWVVSGTEDTDEVYLLDDLGFTKISKDRVLSYNSSKNEITFEKAKKVKVAEGFDFEGVKGLRLNAWLDGSNKIAVYTKVDAPRFDATVMDKAKIRLVTEKKSYVVNEKAVLYLDGELLEADDKFVSDYAKVILNADDEIVWAEGFTFDGNIVVEEVKDEMVYGFDGDELDVEDYTLVKDGKTLSLDDVEEADILFFNKDEGYAVVFNKSVEGEIERVYADSFKFAGKAYSNENVRFLDEDVMGAIDADTLAAMKDEGEVEVFFNFANAPVLVVGARGEAKTNYFYGLVAENTAKYDTRGKEYYTFDVLNPEGKVVKYDVTKAFADKYGDWAKDIVKNAIVKVTVDEDNSVTKVETLAAKEVKTAFKTSATYAEGSRLQAGTIVFWNEDSALTAASKYDVLTWEEAADEFGQVKEGVVYSTGLDRVAAIYVTDTDANTKTESHTGLVTKVRTLRGGDAYEVTIEVAGEAKVFLTELDLTGYEDEFITVSIGDKSGEIESYKADLRHIDVEIAEKGISTSAKTIKATNGKTYELTSKAVIYDIDLDQEALRDLKAGDYVRVYFDGTSSRFVNYVVVVDEIGEPGEEPGEPEDPQVTAEAQVIENALIKKFLVTVRLSDETKNEKVTGFIIDGTNYAVKQITDDGRVQADYVSDNAPTTVKVVVDGKTVDATIK